MSDETFRSNVLFFYGASVSEIKELLFYNQNAFDHSNIKLPITFPLADEPFVSAWQQYSEEAKQAGVFECLRQRLVQLSFPIKEGVCKTDDYIAATRKGVPVMCLTEATGLSLNQPDELQLVMHQSPAGKIPLLIVGDRRDFITMTQALSMRNEPGQLADSMGACMVAGFNNWDRIGQLRRKWESRSPSSDWALEFRRIISRKELYQDRFIILSNGPYSNVSAGDMGLREDEWRKKSLIIRRDHECTHYFTRRMFCSMRNNIIDELIADYAGIIAACGCYRSDWFLRFVGLENFPDYRKGSRLENYRGDPPLSDGAFKILQVLVMKAAENLEYFDTRHREEFQKLQDSAILLMALTFLTLEKLASKDAIPLLRHSVAQTKKLFRGKKPVHEEIT